MSMKANRNCLRGLLISEAMQAMVQTFLENARRLYAGEPLLTPLC
ncbi:hypothetical protein [Achromobacter sp.]